MNRGIVVIKRVDVASCAKLALVLYGVMGLIMGALSSLFAVLGRMSGGSAHSPDAPLFGLFMGLGAVFFMPLLYGILGAVVAAIGAAVFNVCVGWVGGLSLHIETEHAAHEGGAGCGIEAT